MRLIPRVALALLLAATVAWSQADDFQREGSGKKRAAKDAIEGKLAPALKVDNWLNTTEGTPLDLASLKGKVVVLDFWGVW